MIMIFSVLAAFFLPIFSIAIIWYMWKKWTEVGNTSDFYILVIIIQILLTILWFILMMYPGHEYTGIAVIGMIIFPLSIFNYTIGRFWYTRKKQQEFTLANEDAEDQ